MTVSRFSSTSLKVFFLQKHVLRALVLVFQVERVLPQIETQQHSESRVHVRRGLPQRVGDAKAEVDRAGPRLLPPVRLPFFLVVPERRTTRKETEETEETEEIGLQSYMSKPLD